MIVNQHIPATRVDFGERLMQFVQFINGEPVEEPLFNDPEMEIIDRLLNPPPEPEFEAIELSAEDKVRVAFNVAPLAKETCETCISLDKEWRAHSQEAQKYWTQMNRKVKSPDRGRLAHITDKHERAEYLSRVAYRKLQEHANAPGHDESLLIGGCLQCQDLLGNLKRWRKDLEYYRKQDSQEKVSEALLAISAHERHLAEHDHPRF